MSCSAWNAEDGPTCTGRWRLSCVADLFLSPAGLSFVIRLACPCFNDKLYQIFVSPRVRSVVNPWITDVLKWQHPMGASRYFLSASSIRGCVL
jgi:hypothetical protein